MSRLQPSTSSESPPSPTAPGDSPSTRGYVSERPSSSTYPRVSEGSENYPSWLPRRPPAPPPAPASTFHSSVGMLDPPPPETFSGGRKATPRSVRVVSLQDNAQASINPQHGRDTTDQTSGSNPLRPRVWSRAATTSLLASPPVNASDRLQVPRFRATGLHPELLRNPSIFARLYFYLLPLMTFYHVPLQTFLDFNGVFIILQVARYPNPSAPGVPGSGKNWALGAAAYITCWLAWIIMVFILYEIVYSFWRRWRVKRPLITPLYLSSSAFNLTCMTSYSNFSFMQYIRFSAFFGENGGLRDGIAETFWFYSQNLPTIALLLPRAGLSLALLLAFTSASPGYVAMLEAGFNSRDETYFRASDGTLTNYARGVLITNAAWTAWRVLILLLSWIGLWVLSGQPCAGLCGPRYRWEEEDNEKSMSNHGDSASDADVLPWQWRICMRLRIQEAYSFCLTVKPPARWSGATKKEEPGMLGLETSPPFEVDQVLAAVGFPSAPPPGRRGALSEELFAYPRGELGKAPAPPPELSEIIPKVVKRSSKDKEMVGPSAPLMKLPYPFTGYGAQVSSKDQIPFPPSPSSRKEKRRSPATSPSDSSEHSAQKVEEQEDDNDEDEDDDDDEDEEGAIEATEVEAEENSEAQPRTSGSMSSLGQPIMSRYPFQLRRPARGGSVSSVAGTHSSPMTHSSTNTRSTESRTSHSTQSTGNRETSSESPHSHGMSSGMSSPSSGYGIPIPMPPRHPQPGRGRARAGTVPSAFPSSPSPIVYAGRGALSRMRVDSDHTETFGGGGYESFLSEEVDGEELMDEEEDEDEEGIEPQMMEQPVPEGPQEAAEGEDSVGLLGIGTRSPKSSMVSSRRRRGHRSDSGRSRSNSHSGSQSGSSRSRAGSAVRSRTQSLIQSIGAASRSSLDLVQSIRSRANSSMARLEEDIVYSSDSRSRSGSEGVHSSNENYTFGVKSPIGQRSTSHLSQGSVSRLRGASSNPSMAAPSIFAPSEATTSHLTAHPNCQEHEVGRLDIPTRPYGVQSDDSRADISTAAQSFITAPATLASASGSSEPVPASWQEVSHMVDRPGTEWRPA